MWELWSHGSEAETESGRMDVSSQWAAKRNSRSGAWTSPEDLQGENTPLRSLQKEEWRWNLSATFASHLLSPTVAFHESPEVEEQLGKAEVPTGRDREGGDRGNLRRCTRFVSSTLHTLRYSGPLVPSHGVSSPTTMWGSPFSWENEDIFTHSLEIQVQSVTESPSWWLTEVAWKTEVRRLWNKFICCCCVRSQCCNWYSSSPPTPSILDTLHFLLALRLVCDICPEGFEFLVALPTNNHYQTYKY